MYTKDLNKQKITKYKMDNYEISYLGEAYVKLELAKEGVRTMEISRGFCFDLVAANGASIEVKTALTSKSKKVVAEKEYVYDRWQFRVNEKQQGGCDFYVCVVLESREKAPIGYFVIPNSHQNLFFNKGGMLHIYQKHLEGEVIGVKEFFNRFDLIKDYKK